MTSPFRIDGPTVISFSGGRTSALMLRLCLNEGLNKEAHVLFANTGKEREETLVFVNEVSKRWSVPITWIERDPSNAAMFRVVTFETASRDGRPFAELIAERDYLPNPIARFCTTELKILTFERYMQSLGYEYWTDAIGLRADEPKRVARMKNGAGRKCREVVCPLAEAGVRRDDVEMFWARSPFNLQLRPWEGNCDLCMLKGKAKRLRILRDRPDLAQWWVEQEELVRGGKARLGTFRNDTPPYRQMLSIAMQPMFSFIDEDPPANDEDDLGDCVCNEAA